MAVLRRVICACATGALSILGACAALPAAGPVSNAGEPGPALPVHGYLSRHQVPDSLSELPPPPAPGSAAKALDEEIARRSFMLKGGVRWKLAISDADLSFPHAAQIYSCALGVHITAQGTPAIWNILQRSQQDLEAAARHAKKHYRRARPFLTDGQPVCTPEVLEHLRKSGSYPSSHAGIGWGWALILAELAPARTDALMVRARAYGESRNVCNVHWHSDVMQGRLLASAVVARLHAEDVFRKQMNAARLEMMNAPRYPETGPETESCQAEAAALAEQPSLAQ